MPYNFNNLADSSKLWIFPSSRKLYPEELQQIKVQLNEFLSQWSANKSAFTICYDRIILVACDTSDINLTLEQHDALSLFIIALEKQFNISLLDKINVCFKQGEYVQYKELKAFKKLISSRGVSKKTIVFNTMISTLGEYKNDWEIPITDSWLNRYL